MHRRWRLVGAILLYMALGWQSALPKPVGGAVASGAASVLAFVALFAGGFLQDRKGPFIVAAAGAVVFTAGFLLSAGGEGLAVGAGALMGVASGLWPAVVVPVLAKWYPDRRGTAIGLTTIAGAVTLIVAPVLHRIASATGWGMAVVIASVPLAVAAGAGAALMRDPPDGWTPPHLDRPGSTRPGFRIEDRTPRGAFRENSFRLLWVVYFLGAVSGLMVVSRAVSLGTERAGLETAVAAGALGVMAFINGLGRIVFGALSDRLGRMRIAAIMNGVYLAVFLLVLPWATGFLKWLLGICLAALSYGAFSTVIPAAAADFFGTRHLGAICALLATAPLAAQIAAHLLSATKASGIAEFIAFSIPAVAGLAICLVLKPPMPGGNGGFTDAG